jgi:N-acetylneuraminate synthase
MATLEEINEAVNAARNAGARQIMLLKCTSSYPAHPEDMNLMTIEHMKKIFKVPVGLSDHSLGTELAVASVAVGASLVEKHFTLSRKVATADRFFSLQPQELKGLVKAIRNTEKALGKISYGARGEERKSLIFRRSLYVVSNIKKGEVFSEDSIRSIRPAFGMKPKYLPGIIGKRASKNIGKGEPLSTEMIV